MAADYPTTLADFLSYTAAAGKGVPYDVFQNLMDEILAVQTLLAASSAGNTAFTPTIISSGGGTPTYSIQVGRYGRVLNRVFFHAHMTLATFGTLAAGNITIGGLPVASANVSGAHSGVHVAYWDVLTTAVVNLSGFIAPNTSVIVMVKATAATTGITSLLTKADLTATTELIVSGHYPLT